MIGEVTRAIHGSGIKNVVLKSKSGRLGLSSILTLGRRAPTNFCSARHNHSGSDDTNEDNKKWSLRRKQEHQYNTLLTRPDASYDIRGDNAAIGATLLEALRLQWAYGFPHTPEGISQLTHGFHYYPAAMQPATAKLMLEEDCILPGTTLLDPFCGGGTTLIEGMRDGRVTFGSDTSPLALFVASGRTWLPKDGDIDLLRESVARVVSEASSSSLEDGNDDKSGMITRKSWQGVKDGIDGILNYGMEDSDDKVQAAAITLAPILWFCYNAAFEQANRSRWHKSNDITSAPQYFEHTVEEYLRGIGELSEASGDLCQSPRLLHSDARLLKLDNGTKVDAILTSPPYPGVYDYMKHAREQRAKLKTNVAHHHVMSKENTVGDFMTTDIPSSRNWPDTWSRGEIGSNKSLRKNWKTFKSDWQRDTDDWIAQMAFLLRGSGSRMAVMIGDGFGIDALESTLAATRRLPEDIALELVASATLRRKGERTEHMVLLERT